MDDISYYGDNNNEHQKSWDAKAWKIACDISHDMIFVGLIIGLIWFFCTMIIGCAHAQEIPEKQDIKAIIGEAENQGFEGMLCIAHALRNRGTLKGVYGLHAPRVRHHLYSRKTLQEATLAWEQSAMDYDITQHATGWGNAEDIKKFEMCRWWGHCRITMQYKDHYFYKEDK